MHRHFMKTTLLALFIVVAASCGSKYVRPDGVTAPLKTWSRAGEWTLGVQPYDKDRMIAFLSNSLQIIRVSDGQTIASYEFQSKMDKNDLKASVIEISTTNNLVFLKENATNLVAFDVKNNRVAYTTALPSKIESFHLLEPYQAFAIVSRNKIHVFGLSDGRSKWVSPKIYELSSSFGKNVNLSITTLQKRNELFLVAGLGSFDMVRSYVVNSGTFYIIDFADGRIKKTGKLNMNFHIGNNNPDDIESFDSRRMFWSFQQKNNLLYLSSMDLTCLDLDAGKQLWTKEIRSSAEDTSFAAALILTAVMIGVSAVSLAGVANLGGGYSGYSYYYFYTPVYTVSTGVKFTSPAARIMFEKLYPAISDNRVVFNDYYGNIHTYDAATGNETFSTANAAGVFTVIENKDNKTLYGVRKTQESISVNREEIKLYKTFFQKFDLTTGALTECITNTNQFQTYTSDSKFIYAVSGKQILRISRDFKNISWATLQTIAKSNPQIGPVAKSAEIKGLVPLEKDGKIVLSIDGQLLILKYDDLSLVKILNIAKGPVWNIYQKDKYLFTSTLDDNEQYQVLTCWNTIGWNPVYMINTTDIAIYPWFVEFPESNILISYDTDMKDSPLTGFSWLPGK